MTPKNARTSRRKIMASSSSEANQLLILHARRLFDKDPTPIIALVNNLFSRDFTLRSDAGTLYDFSKKNYLNSLVSRLVNLLNSSPNDTTRNRVAKLLRRLFSAPHHRLFRSLSRMTQAEFKGLFVTRLRTLTDEEETLKILCSTASDIAGDLLPKNQWDELFGFMTSFFSVESADIKQCKMLLFSELIPKCAEFFSPLADSLYTMFQIYLNEQWEVHRVKVAAVRASVQFILYLTTPASHENYYCLLSYMVRALLEVLPNEEENARIILEEMIVLVGAQTEFIRLYVPHLFEIMLGIAENSNFEIKTRQLAIEFMITVAEDRGCGCGVVQGMQSEIKKLLSVLMEMLSSIEEDPSWDDENSDDESSDDDEDEGDGNLYCYAKESMSRLANALRGDSIVPNYPEELPIFLDGDWKSRHAVVTALGLISEGCSKVLVNNLDQPVEKLLQLIRDPHPRVRCAAIHSIGQFSEHLCPHLQQQFHQLLIPALTAAMDDFDNPIIQVMNSPPKIAK